MTNEPSGYVDQYLADVASAKYYFLGAFPENMKQLSLILINTWRFEATYAIQLGMRRQEER